MAERPRILGQGEIGGILGLGIAQQSPHPGQKHLFRHAGVQDSRRAGLQRLDPAVAIGQHKDRRTGPFYRYHLEHVGQRQPRKTWSQ